MPYQRRRDCFPRGGTPVRTPPISVDDSIFRSETIAARRVGTPARAGALDWRLREMASAPVFGRRVEGTDAQNPTQSEVPACPLGPTLTK